MKWTVFDLEFNELLPQGDQPWPDSLHITCASVYSTGDTWPQVWHEVDAVSTGSTMSRRTLEAFVDTLGKKSEEGHTLVTWGGAASDWRMLARECSSKAAMVRQLALDSVDVPMCSCMAMGTMMGLNAACMALGFSLKEAEASASMPTMWASADGRAKVLQHVSNDSFATMLVVKHIETTASLPWITQKGQLKTWHGAHLMPVKACLARELPKVPWVIGPNHNPKVLARWLLLE